jgi:GntR family transcriptional regulator
MILFAGKGLLRTGPCPPVDMQAAPNYGLPMTIDKGSSGRPPDASGDGVAAGSPIGFRLDPASGVPTYLQLVHQVEQALRLGYLKEGDRLPTVKEAVESLAINPNTVLKAYRELEHRGLAAGKPGQGTFIAGTLRQVGIAEQAALRKSLLTWLRSADDAGLDGEGIAALFAASLQDFLERRDEQGPRRGGDQPGGRPAARAQRRTGAVA